MKKSQLMQGVGAAYPGDFPRTLKQARAHVMGDTLADFIYMELFENLPSDIGSEEIKEAVRSMRMALRDIQAVLVYLESKSLESSRDCC